ncbi:MAG TPA: hypothetical protein VFQ39_20405 [Longimicrobium sp.]|nr:hypothetical protein [Longimicrobium sp.]
MLSTLLIGLVTNLVSSDPSLSQWYAENRTAVLVLGAAMILVAIVAEASDAVDQVSETGGAIAGLGLFAHLLVAATVWGVTGFLIGLSVGEFVFPLIAGLPGSAAREIAVQLGPTRIAAALCGIFAGTQLKLADYRKSTLLSFAGAITGGVLGLSSMPYFASIRPLTVTTSIIIGVPALAAACIGIVIGALTATFKPRHDRIQAHSAQLASEAAARRVAQEKADLELFERTVTRLRRLGCDVRPARPKRPTSIVRTVAEHIVFAIAENPNQEQRDRLGKVISDGTLADVVDCLADIHVAKATESSRSSPFSNRRSPDVIRDQYINNIRGNPMYGTLKSFFDESTPVDPDVGQPPRPPYILVDTEGQERVFHSLQALAGYPDG